MDDLRSTCKRASVPGMTTQRTAELTQTEMNALRRKEKTGKFGVSARTVDKLIAKSMIRVSDDGRAYILTPQARRALERAAEPPTS